MEIGRERFPGKWSLKIDGALSWVCAHGNRKRQVSWKMVFKEGWSFVMGLCTQKWEEKGFWDSGL